MANYEDVIRYVSYMGSAISDGNRLRLLMALQGRSLCVCQLTELLSLAPSTVSKHLSILKQAGLVKEKKQGRWVYHELSPDNCSCYAVLNWVRQQLARDEQVAQDKVRLKEILQMDAEELCRK
jgi:ArsR family transcriptional regulator, arsenate/arsenite/antimonite-responsive transcriptional repressor